MDNPTISKILLDGMFLLPQITGNCLPLDLPGIRGWASPLAEPYANRVGLVSRSGVAKTIRQVCDFFAQRRQGFTLVLGAEDISAGLAPPLLEAGFKPARFHRLAGLVREAPYPDFPFNPAVRIGEIPLEETASYAELYARAYGVPPAVARYLFVPRIDRASLRARYFIAYFPGREHPVGFSISVTIADGSAVLFRGAGVIPELRRQGVYTALVRQRLNAAAAEGTGMVFLQAGRETSCPICLRLGFQEVCAMEWYEWSPSLSAPPGDEGENR